MMMWCLNVREYFTILIIMSKKMFAGFWVMSVDELLRLCGTRLNEIILFLKQELKRRFTNAH